MSASFNIDARTDLIEALKLDPEKFQQSCLVLPKVGSIRAVYELEAIRSEMLDFAKNPEIGTNLLGKPPRKPDTTNMSPEDADQAEYEYHEMLRMYEHQKLALSMHIPYADMIMIDNYLKKFHMALNATAAIKGKRFYAFTKNQEEKEPGLLDFMKRGNSQ